MSEPSRIFKNAPLGSKYEVRVIKHTYGMQGDTMNHFYLYFVPMGRVQQKFGMTHVFFFIF
jgi:hypothetical protein